MTRRSSARCSPSVVWLVGALSFHSLDRATAQSFNVDHGMNLILAPAPNDSYSGAATQPGRWNAYPPSFTPTTLIGLDGTPSGVTLSVDSTSSATIFPSVIAPGGDQALMEDVQVIPSLFTRVTFTLAGLTDGAYELFVYASDPSNPSVQTSIGAPSSGAPDQVVGAGWPGAHAAGQTYATFQVMASGGALQFHAEPVGTQFDSGVVNGFQLVQLNGPILTLNYCTPAVVNSSGVAASIGGFGTLNTAANNVTLIATDLPLDVFGFFIVSRTQGSIAQPPGSAGVLCLGGTIGRYVRPGQIRFSGPGAAIQLTLDLTLTPEGGAFVAIQPGDTWNFQAWFRDNGPGGAPSSNFTDGIRLDFY